MKCAIFEEHSSSCVVYFRFSGTLFPVSMIDGDQWVLVLIGNNFCFRIIPIAKVNIEQYSVHICLINFDV